MIGKSSGVVGAAKQKVNDYLSGEMIFNNITNSIEKPVAKKEYILDLITDNRKAPLDYNELKTTTKNYAFIAIRFE
jgi:hypothetical protein